MSANADAVSKLDLGAATPAHGAAQIQGYVDAVEPDRIYGWAWNTSDPSERLSIEIRQGEQLIVRLEANQPRPDLVTNGIGDGRYAFVANIPSIADIDRASPLTVLAMTADGTTSIELKRQSGAPGPGAVSANVLGEIRARDQRLQGQLKQLVSVAKERGGLDQTLNERVTQSLEKLDVSLPELDHRLAAMEVFQLRFDTLLQGIDKRLATIEQRSQPRQPLLLWVWTGIATAVAVAFIAQYVIRSL